MPNLYQILGVIPSASAEEIRRAYKQRALETHPDKLEPSLTVQEKRFAEEKFHRVYDAFEILSDPEKRKAYDIRANIARSGSYQFVSEESKRRAEDRAEWARKQQELYQIQMAEFREQNRLAREEMRVRMQEAAEQAKMVNNMVDELCKLQPDWEKRKADVQQRRASRLNGNPRWSTVQ